MIKSMFSLVMLLAGAQALADTTDVSEPYYQDQFTLVNQRNFLSDYQPLNPDGTVNVVVERPTGSVQAWHINAKSGAIVWQQDKGKARSVHYLGYPGNFGFVPRTLSSEEGGGDGAPLDAIVLGPAVPRGEVVKVKLIGMLKLLELMELHGANLGAPHTAPMGGGLFEVRAKAKEGIGRALFCYMKHERIYILHAFIKKTQKTPLRDLDLAKARLKEVSQHE